MSGKDETDFQFLAENSVDMICRIGMHGMDMVMRYVSPSCHQVLGWTPEEMNGKGPESFILAEDMPILGAAIARILVPGVQTDIETFRMRKKDGSVAWVEMNTHLIRDSTTNKPEEVVVVMRDVTEHKMLEEKLSTLALTDGLTGILNRRAFDEALEREWKRTLRDGSQISLLMLDIDHFKNFNDQYGHQAGDDCLRAVAAAVSGAVRATDIVARYGGEEIVVILPSTYTAGAVETAEKVCSAIEALRLPNEGDPEGNGWLTVSVGVATALARMGGTMRMPESLLLAADNAMYKAKNKGRNCVATAVLIAPKNG